MKSSQEGQLFVSIIIPTYNRSNLLAKTIESFLEIDYPKQLLEIIISDNNSSDDTREVVNSFLPNETVNVRYHFEKRQGVHFARNAAAKLAKGEILYFTDDDMIADRNMLIELIPSFGHDPKIGTATGRVLPKWEVSPAQWVLNLMSNHLLSLNDPPEEFVISNKDCMVFSCHQAIRKEAFFDAGGYNPENTKGLWMGDGETGLNIKLEKLGHKFAFNGKSVIHHSIPKQRMTFSYLVKRLLNQANCDSYTEYRKSKPNAFRLILNSMERMGTALTRFLSFLICLLTMRDIWRIRIASVAYHAKRIVNDLSLAFSARRRRFTLKDDWLSDTEERKDHSL